MAKRPETEWTEPVEDTHARGGADPTLTTPESIPPVHVLEAAYDQERKEAEELLAGFDRPGRSPRRSHPSRDFVDYYAGREIPRTPPPGAVAKPQTPPKPRKMQETTDKRGAVKALWQRRRSRSLWIGAIPVFLGVIAGIAYLAFGQKSSSVSPAPSVVVSVNPAPTNPISSNSPVTAPVKAPVAETVETSPTSPTPTKLEAPVKPTPSASSFTPKAKSTSAKAPKDEPPPSDFARAL